MFPSLPVTVPVAVPVLDSGSGFQLFHAPFIRGGPKPRLDDSFYKLTAYIFIEVQVPPSSPCKGAVRWS